MNDDILEKIVLYEVLNSKEYNWDMKFNSYGDDISVLNSENSEIRDRITKKFVDMMLHDRKANSFIRRNGYSILATSLSYSDVLNSLLECESIEDEILDMNYFFIRWFLDLNAVVRTILKISNDDVRLKKYFEW